MRALATKTLTMLGDLPPYLSEDPFVRNYLDAAAREVQRFEDTLERLRARVPASGADDEYRTLGMYEQLLGLPVEQAGATFDERKDLVLAGIRQRNVSSGARWVELITKAVGSGDWRHTDDTPDYTVTIYLPYAPGGYRPGQLIQYARKITPAHLALIVTYEGFIVEASLIESDLV